MKIDRAKLRAAANIRLTCEPEESSIEGNACSHEGCEECHAWIRDQLDSGNEWAWCCVTVWVEFAGVTEHDSLGACSYESEADFKQPGGYYDDMINEAIERLATRLEEQNDALVTHGLI